jgi:hypothetical protein
MGDQEKGWLGERRDRRISNLKARELRQRSEGEEGAEL